MSGVDILRRIQRRIEHLHGSPAILDVRAFVVDEATWRAIPGAREGVPEQLFVRQDPAAAEELEIALYIAPAVVEALAGDDPDRRLHAGNLESFCVALEGVSHFVLVTARASAGRPVTALELEIQAEVDKFVIAWLLLVEQGNALAASARQLSQRLFGRYELRDRLPREEADRYHVATRVARRFCDRLTARHGRDGDTIRIAHAVRRFVRMDLAEKLRAA